jgi:Undecaprenyl-phosphate galactose phosphotransferase WbaP
LLGYCQEIVSHWARIITMSQIPIGIPLAKGKAASHPKIKFQTYHRARMFVTTFMSDWIALILATTLVHIAVYRTFRFDYISMGEIEHILFVIICFSLFMTSRLYPGIGLNPALEMKAVTQLTSVSSLIVFSFLMIRAPFWSEEKLVLVVIGALSIFTILGLRWLIRILAVQVGFWGEPVVVVASGEKLDHLMHYFNERRRLGFVPILGVTSNQSSLASHALEMDGFLRLPDNHFAHNGIHTVLVSTQIASDLSKSRMNRVLLRKFKRMIFVSDMTWLEGASISYHDFEGMLAMEAQQNLLALPDEMLKRMMDILLSIMLGALSLPVLFLTALMIKLDSTGQVFYQQERVGKDGRRITIFKFRTMQMNAEEILAGYLVKHPDARREWNETQKLREDPRITRVGKWLRKFSVDELPQLLNILKGDMSIVGPRPIMCDQRNLYGDEIDVYTSVRPGLTGFWQVSGRNRTSFSQRAAFDVYYVRNWSVWLDMYILLRTVWVVLSRDGAY